jgi:hypothetical protein
MDDDAPRRNLHERTGKHLCIQCMKEVPAEEYFGNDFFCDACAVREASVAKDGAAAKGDAAKAGAPKE